MTICIDKRARIIFVGSVLLAFLGAGLLKTTGEFAGLPLFYNAMFTVAVFLGVGLLPGYLITVLMGPNGFSLGVRFLLSVGISLTFDSVIGICISMAHHAFPDIFVLRSNILFSSFFVVDLLLLAVYSYRKKGQISEAILVTRNTAFSIGIAMLFIMGSILGTYVANTYSSPDVIVGLLLFVAIFVLFQGCGKLHPGMNGIIIWSLGLAVIFHRDLMTGYIIGTDIQMTHYVASYIANVGYWAPAMGHSVTDLAYSAPAVNIVIVPAIYKEMAGISIYIVQKYFNAFLFSLVPLGMYYAVRDSGERRAFWSAVVFVFYFEFFAWTPGKQEIAELFLILFVLVMNAVNRDLKNRVGSMSLVLILLSSIPMAHEGISWILVFLLPPAMLASRIFKGKNVVGNVYIFYLVVVSAWYINLANGAVFDGIVYTIKEIIGSVSGMFVTVQGRTAVSTVAYLPPSVLWRINVYLYYVLTLLLVVGIVSLLKKGYHQRAVLPDDSQYLDIAFFAFLMVGFFITGNFGSDRAYQISLLVLSPYVVDGYNVMMAGMGRLFAAVRVMRYRPFASDFHYVGFSLFLGVYFLFNTGLVYHLMGQPVGSAISLNPNANTVAYNTAELTGAMWLKRVGNMSERIYSDQYSQSMLYSVFPGSAFAALWLPLSADELLSYVFVRQRSVVKRITGIDYGYLEASQLSAIASGKSQIYSNGSSMIFD